jgi:hypothetical protein
LGMTGEALFLCLGLCTFRLPFYALLFCHIHIYRLFFQKLTPKASIFLRCTVMCKFHKQQSFQTGNVMIPLSFLKHHFGYSEARGRFFCFQWNALLLVHMSINKDTANYSSFAVSVFFNGGGEGSRTPIRKQDQPSLSERSP